MMNINSNTYAQAIKQYEPKLDIVEDILIDHLSQYGFERMTGNGHIKADYMGIMHTIAASLGLSRWVNSQSELPVYVASNVVVDIPFMRLIRSLRGEEREKRIEIDYADVEWMLILPIVKDNKIDTCVTRLPKIEMHEIEDNPSFIGTYLCKSFDDQIRDLTVLHAYADYRNKTSTFDDTDFDVLSV